MINVPEKCPLLLTIYLWVIPCQINRWFPLTLSDSFEIWHTCSRNCLETNIRQFFLSRSSEFFFTIAYFVLLHMLNHNISKIQSGHSVILASSFGQTRPSVLKPDDSHLSDGPLIIMSLQLLLTIWSYNLQSLFVV